MKKNQNVDIEKAKAEYENEKYRYSNSPNAVSGINTPGIDLPAFNPPVPNRAWTEMKKAIETENSVASPEFEKHNKN